MILSLNSGPIIKKLGTFPAIKAIADGKFDAYDITFCCYSDDSPFLKGDYEDYTKKLRNYSDSLNIICNQAHATYPTGHFEDDKYNEKIINVLKREIECAGILGAKNIIIHPIHPIADDVSEIEYNVEFYKKLLPFAKAANVKIATENMFGRDKKTRIIRASVCGTAKRFADMLDALHEVDSEYFTGCLDVGHCGLVGEEADYVIRKLGNKRINAMHIHDNDYIHDLHALPFIADINWDNVLKAISDIHYNGDFTYEVELFFKKFPPELIPDAISFAHKVGLYLISKIEQ